MYRTWEILSRKKLANLANHKLFAKNFLANQYSQIHQKHIWHMK